jgi:xylose isomerase
MDAFARGLKIAHAILSEGRLSGHVTARYASWDGELGQQIEAGKSSFAALEKLMLEKGDSAATPSGRQEMLENLINEYI